MENIRFEVRTVMEKSDYRKLLCIATFFRNKAILPMIIFISFAGSFIINCFNGFNAARTLIMGVFLSILSVIVITVKVERINNRYIRTGKTGAPGSEYIYRFYDKRLEIVNETIKSNFNIDYDKVYGVRENRDYLIFYLSVKQAALIRKKDISDNGDLISFLKDVFDKRYSKI